MDVTQFLTLRDTVEWARSEYERTLDQPGYQSLWDQRTYLNKTECGTAACIAGRAGLEAGYVPSLYNSESYFAWRPECPLDPDRDGEVGAFDLGQHLMGLDYDEADRLFSGGNDISDIERISHKISLAHGFDAEDWILAPEAVVKKYKDDDQ